jgi:hypothetical protein
MSAQKSTQTRLFTQVGLGLLVLVAVVFGIAFISQYQGASTPKNTPPQDKTPPGSTVRLKFLQTVVKWNPPSMAEFEHNTDAYYDFWFENPNNESVEMGIGSKSCTCMAASICVLSAQNAERYHGWTFSRAASECGVGFGGVLPFASQCCADLEASPDLYGMDIKWRPLAISETEPGTVVQPGQAGLVRIEARKAKMGAKPLRAPVWTQLPGPGHQRDLTLLEVPMTWVIPIRFLPDPALLDVGDLGPKDEKTVEGYFFSSTRKFFPIYKIEERNRNPHVSFTWTPMTDAEREEMSRSTQTRVLCGYKLRVTVRERLGAKGQMDLGPFMLIGEVTTDADVGLGQFQIDGTIKGEINVGAAEDGGKILLGNFKADKGKSKTVLLTTNRPGMSLEYAHTEPTGLDFLKVPSLKPVPTPGVKEVTQWELQVTVPPGPPRRIPHDGAVLVRITSPGSPPRFIRIPVIGTAYQ